MESASVIEPLSLPINSVLMAADAQVPPLDRSATRAA
jgi:hypothetical protein